MSMSTALARPGCGCGGGGGSGGSGGSASGCTGCGSGATSGNPAATAFVRPRFFAGQLLTEDDLTALADYTIAKDRLHNRYLFGAGVVCGLWVSCDPCGGGTVTVNPGYALDCCGRDLVLGAAAPLDVNAMIRELLAAQLGTDCGDPCAGQGASASTGQSTPVTRHYRLFARYGEQQTDPVAPYATGDQCGPVTCEPTRIREGISFVLKCAAKPSASDDFVTRLRACQPGDEILRRRARLEEYSGPMAAAVRAAEYPAAFGPEEADDLRSLRTGLAAARSAGDKDEVRSAIGHVRGAAALVARYDLAHDHPDLADHPELADLPEIRAELRAAATALAEGAAAAAQDPVDRPAVDALLDQAAKLAGQAPGLPRVQLAMLAQGLPLNQHVLDALSSDAAAVKEWLLDRLDGDPALADCEVRSQVRAVSVTTEATGEVTAKVRSLRRAGSELAGLFARVVQDCICRAVNPPCTPCDDTDVPLACLEVADCTVVSICNAERDYVLSGSALRYWRLRGLPPEVAGCSCGCGEPGSDVLQPDPIDLLREVREPVEVGAPVEVGVPASAGQAAPSAAVETTDGALARQVHALEQRLTELTAQLTQTQAGLGVLGGGSPAGESPAKESPEKEPSAQAVKTARRRASTPRRRPAAAQPAETQGPADAPGPAQNQSPAERGAVAAGTGDSDDS